VCHHNDVGYNDVNVVTKGGKLVVKYDRQIDNTYTNVWLCGPAEKAFEGRVEVEIKKLNP
jgi:diaminopimelate epimerase